MSVCIFFYCCSVAKSCLTSLQPHAWQPSRLSLSLTFSQSLPKFMSMNISVMPSNHLILCRPLLLPSTFPSIRVFSSESAVRIKWPKYWSLSFSISPSSEYAGFISFRIDCYTHTFYIFKYTLQVHTHTYTQHIYTHVHVYMCVHVCIQCAYMYTYTHVYPHAYKHIQIYTHKYIYTYIHTTHIHTYNHIYTQFIYIYTHTYTHTYINTHSIYIHTHIHTHTHTRIYPHTHIYMCCLYSCYFLNIFLICHEPLIE